ncbi:hypothetical protein T484DRAFT_1892367, partial [Baffinella frigidus]
VDRKTGKEGPASDGPGGERRGVPRRALPQAALLSWRRERGVDGVVVAQHGADRRAPLVARALGARRRAAEGLRQDRRGGLPASPRSGEPVARDGTLRQVRDRHVARARREAVGRHRHTRHDGAPPRAGFALPLEIAVETACIAHAGWRGHDGVARGEEGGGGAAAPGV